MARMLLEEEVACVHSNTTDDNDGIFVPHIESFNTSLMLMVPFWKSFKILLVREKMRVIYCPRTVLYVPSKTVRMLNAYEEEDDNL